MRNIETMQYFGFIYCIYVLIALNAINFAACEPVTIGLLSTALVAGWYKWDMVKEKTVCRFTECCNANYIPYDLDSKYFKRFGFLQFL